MPEFEDGEADDSELARSVVCGGVRIELAAIGSGLRKGLEDVTGFVLWQAATEAVCEKLLANGGALVRGKRVVELGCGLGVLGLFCAKMGAAQVLLTDLESTIVQLAAKNAEANGRTVASRCDFAVWNFEQPPPFNLDDVDVIVASDVLFLDKLGKPLLAAFEAVAAKRAPGRGCLGLLGHEVRRAVYRDAASGKICTEEFDSALEQFLQLAGGRAECIGNRRGGGMQDGDESSTTSPAVLVTLSWPPKEIGQEADAAKAADTAEPLAKRTCTRPLG
eukprot:TRINITY_DN52210_c0_g1_i2.p1 TRINITY_DN52210_c0_g1~~TRINITY_DN52210_c0_g1_i2.p1  ORF type:complete len:277 (+),score=66.40 TRINITY_DN52210_c0_g1_i2:244-1074(+)